MHILYRLVVFVLGIAGAAAALGINVFYSASIRFQNLVGLHEDAPHGWLGLGCVVLGFAGACLVLSRLTMPAGVILLLIAGIGFFFVVNWWALLASPQMLLAAFFAAYYYLEFKHEQEVRGAEMSRQEYPPQQGGTPAVG
ncbi:MAG TPA: hypothetical protein VF099_13555 [Ktedonobacterales bacterium]